MAAKAIKYPLSRTVTRSFATKPAVKSSDVAPPDVNCTVLPNKLMVGSLDLYGPLTRVSVYVRVGPRNETYKNLGIVHAIRLMTGFSTQRYTGFAVMRNIQQCGAQFTVSGDREVTSFNIVGARTSVNCALKYLSAVVSTPVFKQWQINDNLSRFYYEIGGLTPQARTMDILHKAAFRKGLGNSLFLKKDHVGTHSAEMMQNFYKEGFTANRSAVVGINVDHADLLEFSKSLELPNNDLPDGGSDYFGGEIRKDKNSYFAHVALATEGVGFKDVKEALAYSVLQHAYGSLPSISWGGSPSPVYKMTFPQAPDAGISCFNISYSDTGLFGVFVSSSAKTAGKAVEEAYKVLKKGSVSEADIKRGKAILKMNILSNCENTGNIIDDMGVQSLFNGVIIPGPVLADAVDKISSSDVTAAARKIANKKFSLAGFGNLSEVPYLDELK